MSKVILKQGEAKTLTLTVTDEDAVAVNLSAATLFLGVKKSKSDSAYAFSKDTFDMSQAAQGIISVFLTDTDTNQTPGPYVGELKVTLPGDPPATVEKSGDLAFSIERAVTT